MRSISICILLASLSLLGSVGCTAIKGRPAQQVERTAKSVPVVAQQQPAINSGSAVPVVFESSKKVYNDESIRRSVGSQLGEQKDSPAKVQVVQPQASAVQPIATAPAPAAVAAPVAAVAEPVAVVPAAPITPVAVAAPVVQVVPVAAPAAADQVKPVAEPLPVQSERSAPIKPSVVVVDHVAPQHAVAKEPQVVAGVPSAQHVQPVEPVASQSVAPVASQPQEVAVPIVAKQAAVESSLQAKNDEPVVVAAPVAVEKSDAAPIEVPAPDPGLVLVAPIDSTTKLLVDLDEHMQKFLPAEDRHELGQPPKEQVLVAGVDYASAPVLAQASPVEPSGKSSAPLVPYSSSAAASSSSPSSSAAAASVDESIVPPLPSLEKVEKASGASASSSSVSGGQPATRQGNNQPHQNQQQVITQLLDQLDSLQNRIQDTINQLVARRRYVMSALLRPMGTYVRRVRTNLERLQNRVNQLQAAATSIGGNNNQNGQNRPGGFVDAAAIETIRRRIDDISKRISDIVNRIRFSLTPTSAPLNSNGRK